MSNVPQNLTRKQLAEFLPDPRAVRMFESLLKQVNELIPTDVATLTQLIQEAASDAYTADAKATQTLDTLNRIADALEFIIHALTFGQVVQAGDELQSPLVPRLAEDNLTPPTPLGTLGMQQSDDVNITGGSITANLTGNQTTLLMSSVTLANGAAAGAGTLTNAPTAGNPTKWVPINDNGTTRYIPAW